MSFDDEIQFDFNRQISSYRAFLLILFLSFLVAVYAIISAQKIIKETENSQVFHYDLREKNLQKNTSLPASDRQIKIKNPSK